MTVNDVLHVVLPLNPEQRVLWLIDLGWAMTVSARGGYPLAGQAEPIPHMMAFNELQRQLYNYLIHSREKDDWTIEDFVKGLCEKAVASGVNGDFGWALKPSLEKVSKRRIRLASYAGKIRKRLVLLGSRSARITAKRVF